MGGKRKPLRPRPLCATCRKKPVKKAEHRYCSPPCAKAARRVARPLCPVCNLNPIPRPWAMETCGKSCAAVRRWEQRPKTDLQAQSRKMHEARRAKVRQRLVAYLRDQVAELEAAATPVERAKVLARVYRRGRHDQSSLEYYRNRRAS